MHIDTVSVSHQQHSPCPVPPLLPPPPSALRTASWRAAVAGAVAGQTLLLSGSQTRQYSLGTYVLLRGLTLLVRKANKPGSDPLLRALLTPTRMK
jgi:hypothetical protein